METEIVTWALGQSVAVVVLLLVCFFQRRDINRKDEQLMEYIQGMSAIARTIDKLNERLR